jgi:hypothetical protein
MKLADYSQMGGFAQKRQRRKSLKNMEPMSGLEQPFGLRITNGDEENDEND